MNLPTPLTERRGGPRCNLKRSLISPENRKWLDENGNNYTANQMSEMLGVPAKSIRWYCAHNNIQPVYEMPGKMQKIKSKVVKMEEYFNESLHENWII